VNQWQAIAAAIGDVLGRSLELRDVRTIGGGCINETALIGTDRGNWFVKCNRAALLPMFEAEAAALQEMADTRTIRVPRPVCHGVAREQSYLAMEYIELGGARGDGQALAGRRLAALHRHLGTGFGWHRDNTIGSTPQPNSWSDDWVEFWRDRRLGFQLELAVRHGHGGQLQRLGERLMSVFPALMDHDPQPSLIHGDLWGGNISFDRAGDPVIYDPASYYADREAELAMTELFGGFTGDFYAAYNESWPLDPGYRVRRDLYQLYHVLNHLNLFGGSYLGQSQRLLQRLLAAIG